MGYTTEFEGEFSCYHQESEHVGVFLKAIREGDHDAMTPLADWLLDHNDPRGEAVARLAKKHGANLRPFWRLFGLKPAHDAYLQAFSETRRVKRDVRKAKLIPDPIREAAGLPLGVEGGYFVAGNNFLRSGGDDSILDENEPPKGQPGLWCQWMPNDDGTAIEWDGGEKFYWYVEWLRYLIKHFLGPWGYLLNGRVTWQGEEEEDTGVITVTENAVRTRRT